MTTLPDSSSDHDLALDRLGDEVARALAAGELLRVDDLASRFGVGRDEAEGMVAALRAIHLALGEDFPERPDLPPPALPADFEVLGELGRGGMGVVYKVRQKSLDRVVALKVLRPAELIFGEAIRRFQSEARTLARLRHRHIVSVHEVGEAGGNVYFTMDLIEGSSLAEQISAGKVTPSRAVRILRQVAGAIAYAHSQGLIHRDLKPGNILLDRSGDAFVVDFGLARDLGGPGDLTATGHILGTPAYMSPEQARGDSNRIGESTDLYALGAVLYECLSGRPPFSGKPLAELIHAVLHEDPTPPSRLAPKTPVDLEVICMKAMEKDPRRRYTTVRALLEDLERFEAGRPILARPPSLLYRLSRFVARQKVALASAALAAGVFAAVLLAFVLPKVGQTPETMLATAEDLHREGQYAAAAFLCERAIKSRPSDDLVHTLRRLLTRCRLGLVRSLETDARWEEAKALCQKSLPGTDTSEQIELLWELAQCQVKTGEAHQAEGTFNSLEEHLGQKFQEEASERPVAPDGEKDAIVIMLDRMAPALLDPAHPGHATAGLLYAGLEGERRFFHHDASRWLFNQGPRTASLLVALLPFLDRELLGSEGWDFYDAATEVSGPDLDEALAKAAKDSHQPLLARRFAADLLSARQDLPLWYGHWSADRLAPDNAAWFESAAALWEGLRGLSHVEQYRKKVEWALRAEREFEGGSDPTGWFAEWMEEHTGYGPGGRRRGALDEYVRWWELHGREDPRSWLAQALGLPEIPSIDRVLDLYLHTPTPEQIDRRNWLHQLLVVSAPETVRVPLRRARGRGEPSTRAMDWYRALGASDPPHLFRIARLVFMDGKPDPELTWQEVHPIRIGEPLTTGTHERLTILGSVDWTLALPGLEPATDRHVSWTRDRVTARATLRWEGRGLTLVAPRSNSGPEGFVISGEGRSYSEGFPRAHLETRLLLVVAEPPGSTPREWTLEDWKRRMLENLDFLLAGLSGPVAERKNFCFQYQSSIRELAWLGTLLPLPEGKNGLKDLEGMLRGVPQFKFLRDPDLTAARLLAGDAGVLDEPDRIRPLTTQFRQDYLGTQYLSRLILSTPDPRIRSFALEHLAPLEIQEEILRTLDDAIQSGRLTAPPELAHQARAASVRARNRNEKPRVYAAAVGIGVGLVGLILVARLLWPGRSSLARAKTAFWVAGLGILILVVRIEVDGADYLPDSLGGALAALGTGILALAARGRARWISPLGFLFCGAASAATAVNSLRTFASWIGPLGAAVAIVSLAPLVRALDQAWTKRPVQRRWRMMLVVFPTYAVSALFYQLTFAGNWAIRIWNAYRGWIPLFSWVILATMATALVTLRAAALAALERRSTGARAAGA